MKTTAHTTPQSNQNQPKTVSPEAPNLFTATQVAEVFFSGHVSYWSVLSMARNGELPCIWIGRRPYFFLDSLMEWKEEQENLPSWTRQSKKMAIKTQAKKHTGGAA